MSPVTATVRERIQAQGFYGLNDATYAQFSYPLRLSPAICMVWTAVGMASASPKILWALVPFAALGAILPGHPFDVLYNYGLRHLLGTPSTASLRGPATLRLRLGDHDDYCGRMGFPSRRAHGRLHRRLVTCSRCVRERKYGVLCTVVHCGHVLRQGGLR